MQLHTVQ